MWRLSQGSLSLCISVCVCMCLLLDLISGLSGSNPNSAHHYSTLFTLNPNLLGLRRSLDHFLCGWDVQGSGHTGLGTDSTVTPPSSPHYQGPQETGICNELTALVHLRYTPQNIPPFHLAARAWTGQPRTRQGSTCPAQGADNTALSSSPAENWLSCFLPWDWTQGSTHLPALGSTLCAGKCQSAWAPVIGTGSLGCSPHRGAIIMSSGAEVTLSAWRVWGVSSGGRSYAQCSSPSPTPGD